MGLSRRRPAWRSVHSLLAAAIVVLAVFVVLWSFTSPGVVPAETGGGGFSAELAMEHVAAIAVEPHPLGSEAIGRVRTYIAEQLDSLGIEAEYQTRNIRNPYGAGELVSIVNVIGRIPGTASTGAIVMVAHHDTVPETPGGNDNSAAVAALLETARVLTSGSGVNNDVILLFTDAEEPYGRAGAKRFLEDAVRRDVRFVVNFEALGGSGPSLLAELSGGGWVLAEFDAAVSHPAAFSFLTGLAEMFGEIGTDFDPFREAGYDGLHFVYMRGSPIYHTAADSADSVSLSSLQHHGNHALGTALHFGEMDLTEDRDDGRMVFSTVGRLLVRHPAAWTIAVSLAAFALAAWSLLRRRVRPPGAGRAVAAGAGSLIAGTAAWLAITSIRSSIGVVEAYAYLAVLLAGTLLMAHRLSGSNQRDGAAAGAVAVWITLALLTSVAAPGLSMMLAWPALAAAGAFLWRPSGLRAATVRFGLVAFPTLVLVLPAIEVFWQTAQPRPGNLGSQLLWTASIPMLLGLTVFGVIAGFWPREAGDGGAATDETGPASGRA